ncbi:MAG: YihY/virulence factor BrkB family protein [Lachnospiraceae bacterium]|nr:YihY/virulence factor BrkB family protein [Lachnospiraceae bacterium]
MAEVTRKVPKKSVLRQTLRLLFTNLFEHNVGKSAAALAYYLLFALFPLLIFASNLLGLLDINVSAVTTALSHFMPKDVVYLVENYLDYVSHTSSQVLLWFALVFSVWFPMRAVKGMMLDVRKAYHLGKPKKPVAFEIRQLIYTVVFLIVLAVTLFLSTMGENILSFIFEFFPKNAPKISGYLLSIWQYVRFIPAGILMFVALGTLYAMSMDEKQPFKTLLPGITASLFAWMIVSIGFSFYVENFASYSIIYGTLGTVIILMVWLYMTSLILILGAELNAALKTIREKKYEEA